jgi:hypothetical protein
VEIQSRSIATDDEREPRIETKALEEEQLHLEQSSKMPGDVETLLKIEI